MPYNPTTNFKLSDGRDLGSLGWITKDYLISVYPSIGPQIGIPPELWVWGNNLVLQLGNNSTTDSLTPITTFSGGSVWKEISSGFNHTIAVKTDGTLWGWGTNTLGQLGNSTLTNSSTPITIFAGGTNWAQVSAGYRFTAATKTDGTLWMWGFNNVGQLGNNTGNDASTPITTFAGGNNWRQVDCGNSHTAAVKTDGTLWTWGNGGNLRLGHGDTVSRSVPIVLGTILWYGSSSPLPEELNRFSGSSHSAAIDIFGRLWTWGSGVSGRLGNGITTGNISTPVTTSAGGTDWKQVSAGDLNTAAIKTDGTLWIWGATGSGRIGNAITTGTISTPVTTFAGGTDWKQVAFSGAQCAAIKTDGTLWAWGGATRLGNASTGIRSTPVTTFAGGTNWKHVSAGYSTFAAIKTDGTLWVWGNTGNGVLGNGTTATAGNVSTPVTTFAGGTDWKQVSCGIQHTAAIKTDGTLWIWGLATNGRLGNAVISGNISTPVTTFSGGTDWKQVDSSNSHTIAIKTDGTLWAWGLTTNGRLGNIITTVSNYSTPVTTFAGGTDWTEVSAGHNSAHNIAIKSSSNDLLFTFGLNTSGQLGNASITQRSSPVTVFSNASLGWKQVSCGNAHTSAVKTDGTLWTWGSGASGGLGNASTTNVSTPITTFAGGTDWKQVASGSNFTGAIKTDGTLWTWGSGSNGRLGNNAADNVSTPVTTFSGGVAWKQISIKSNYVASLKVDGTIWTWGYNSQGQLGDNSTVSKSVPVTTFAGGADWKQVSAGDRHISAIKSVEF